ncbi:MAG: lytic transglycosylase domain-containing protein [Blastocatellia bacterium]
MFVRKVIVSFVLMAAALAAMRSVARGQSAAETGDPVARARQRIEAVVARRADIADRVLEASKLLHESSAARKRGARERAEIALRQAEAISVEITPSQQSQLADELARGIAAERAALHPTPPERQQAPFPNALPARRPAQNVAARYREHQYMLGRILVEEQVPVELLAVAFVESRFNPLALSPKGARGIWQLMPATAARYGLAVHPANDHRTHPEHSTRAAARYLRDLYHQFGDWKLALAAYNAGEDRVRRIIDRTGIRDFNEMARRGLLPLETRNYVPAVMALWPHLAGAKAVENVR